ncbi:MAG: Stp1/IreP family PP2C-type Ser/Thr phosphatase [Actinobacteria bacterium]|nr:Stp1/IreP family PP2C-type Ser/Thr phosphatase [Actinomycetota bacterium]
MKYFGATDIGNMRENNEDCFYAMDDLFIVADGMGGHRAGEIASSLSVDAFVVSFTESINRPSNIQARYIKKNILESVKTANNEVFRKSMVNSEYSGMGTTFTACFVYKNTIHIAHIGDSRAYLCRDKNIDLLTSDHTFVGELYRRGEITYEETFNHPQRNFLTNVLGASDEVSPDYLSINVFPGDSLIICSDGLNSIVRDEMISKISEKYPEPGDTVKKLIETALKKGGNDNITVIAVSF